MSAIEKLQIRGIRSFSPNRDETIEFYSPLTMIVGANGCGKTTIIECLKMACTGVLPPTCKNGQSFINDPGMTDSTEVKAHIKLRFINRAGNPSVVVRLFQITKRRAKLEFKSLDGTVRIADEKGNKETLSYKCSDLDKHVPELLGVSAAIMESKYFLA
jgi:DNA repair protein RAD50